ncbi:MAG: SufE family protein [Rhodothermales bacterium]
MNTIAAEELEIIEEFNFFDDWMGRYEHLIDLGRSLPLIDPEFQTDEFKIKGCQSQVWLKAWEEDQRVFFSANSDAAITKGLIALLVRVLSGQPPAEIVNADLGFLEKLEMKEHLSPTRKNGLNAMIKQMKLYALAFQNIASGHKSPS